MIDANQVYRGDVKYFIERFFRDPSEKKIKAVAALMYAGLHKIPISDVNKITVEITTA